MSSGEKAISTGMALRNLDAAAIGTLCRQYRVQWLDLFGSAVGLGFSPERSDLDFIVAFEPMGPAEYAAAYLGLRDALERLSGRAVDLITEAALVNPYLRRSVDAERRILFAGA